MSHRRRKNHLSVNIRQLLTSAVPRTPLKRLPRAWAYETAIAIGCDDKIDPTLPQHVPWRDQFRQTTLFPTLEQILGEPRVNRNSQKRLQDILQHVTEQLRFVQAAPSVQMQAIPPDLGGIREDVEQRLKEENEERSNELRRAREAGTAALMEF
ncbi:hypothetical protein NQ176_g8098 [Zarea fungicola]|uniref:Uncharacterized protein n=1 Tax=Zarea fungicola TaxID=93591 RepID=A0ACC1MUE8_9HYPO|nr:hypothetical protein NQ176_g8098 [Lecanicillium fungicola]